jgi:hypothetical protein
MPIEELALWKFLIPKGEPRALGGGVEVDGVLAVALATTRETAAEIVRGHTPGLPRAWTDAADVERINLGAPCFVCAAEA